MFNPHITFHKSVKKDLATLRVFIKDAKYDNGRSLDWAVFNKYPRLKKYFTKNELRNFKEINLFVNNLYKSNSKIIQKNLNIYESNWKKIENEFYKLTEEIFGKIAWPKGEYIAYLTIWGMFPRFLEDKTFQIPAKYRRKKYVSVVIAHEMLHFIFYAYFLAKYPKYKGKRNYFFVWHVSEIFNSVIQDSPKWLKLFKIECMPYPEHKKIIKILSKKYYKMRKWNVNSLIADIIILVNKNRRKLG